MTGMLRAEPGESIVAIQMAAPDGSCETRFSKCGNLTLRGSKSHIPRRRRDLCAKMLCQDSIAVMILLGTCATGKRATTFID